MTPQRMRLLRTALGVLFILIGVLRFFVGTRPWIGVAFIALGVANLVFASRGSARPRPPR